MKVLLYSVATLMIVYFLASCRNEPPATEELSNADKAFLKGLGLLDNQENVILFNSQGGGFKPLQTSGNFFTNKRIASYWIDEYDSANNSTDFAFYADIDTIWRYPKYNSLTLASYLEVHRSNGTRFKVYVSGDSAETWGFFNRALKEWSRNKHGH